MRFIVIALAVVGLTMGWTQNSWAQNIGPNLLSNSSFEQAEYDSEAQALDWSPLDPIGYSRSTETAHTGGYSAKLTASMSAHTGLIGRITLNQTTANPVVITAYVKGDNIPNDPDDNWGITLALEIHPVDGDTVYTNTVKNTGTFNWRKIGINTGSLGLGPIAFIDVIPLMGQLPSGTAWIDDVEAREFQPADHGGVTFCVDDGEATTLVAFNKLQAYHFPGVAAIISGFVGSDDYYLSWDQVTSLQNNGWEIACHTVDHPHLLTLGETDQFPELFSSLQTLQSHQLRVSNLVWPYGEFDQSLIDMAGSMGYASSRGVDRGYNPSGTLPWDIRIQEVDANISSSVVADWINYAKLNHVWLFLVFHSITNDVSDRDADDIYYCTPTMFHQVVDMVHTSGLPVVTYREGLRQFGLPSDKRSAVTSNWLAYR